LYDRETLFLTLIAILFLPPATRAADTAALLREAGARYSKGQFAEAENAYRQVLAAEPQSDAALLGAAKCRIALGSPREALPFVNQILSRKPGDHDARRELGHAYATGNVFPQAEQIFKDLVDSDPADKESLYYLGCLMYQNGYYGAALTYLERSRDSQAVDPVRQVKTEVYHAVCLSRVGRTQDAETALRDLAIKPPARQEPDLLLVYAELLYETGRPDLALKQADDSLRVNPSLAMGHFWRARILFHLKRLPEAAAAAERSVDLIPQLPYPHSLLVRIYQAQGRPADAARQADWLRQYEERMSPSAGPR
jgi:tetratricopeptide (TPR) repeat protein